MLATVLLVYFPNGCALMFKAASHNPMDWCNSATLISVIFLISGSSIIFVGCSVIQNAALSIISKTSTSKLNRNIINIGVLKNAASLIGKLFGNLLLVLAWLSYRLTSVDYMNFIAISFFIMMTLGYHRVKKNYFFLSN